MRVQKSMFVYNCLTATSPHVSDPAQLCRWPRGLWNPPGGSFSTQVSVSLPTILPWGQTKTNHSMGLQAGAWRGKEDWVIWDSLPPIGHWPKELTWVWVQLMFKVCAQPLFDSVGIFSFQTNYEAFNNCRVAYFCSSCYCSEAIHSPHQIKTAIILLEDNFQKAN